MLFGIEFRNLGIRLPIIEVADIFSLCAPAGLRVALVGMLALWLFLTRTYHRAPPSAPSPRTARSCR